MSDRQIHFNDKEKLYKSFKGLNAKFSIDVLSLFKDGEEITTKELSVRSGEINHGYRFNRNAINKVLMNELKDKVESCGKNKWKLKATPL